jgi:hypothetical protein
MSNTCSTHGGNKKLILYQIIIEKHQQKQLLEKPSHWWEDNIKTNLDNYGVWSYELHTNDSGWDLMVGSCTHSEKPSGSITTGNLMTSWINTNYSQRL